MIIPGFVKLFWDRAVIDSRIWRGSNKAIERDRTVDLLITNQLLYQLSYDGLPTLKNAAPQNRTGDTRIFSPLLYQLS
jgi:hypothetical protein